MTGDTIHLEVDGRRLEGRPGQMLIEITDRNDIYVPRFCYHHKLSIAANCRMCLVDVEKSPKPLPACATPVTDGMVVRTKSALAHEAQKSVMEFLLINHPLDCPICDQGGECELQDLAVGYGSDVSRYQEKKRVVQDKNIGPLIQTDMTRCIHCTRCVRFGEEIAGLREIGVTGRGEYMEIGTYIEKTVHSEMSGNIIDICPVGALTSRPFRYSVRAWELAQKDAIAPHDSTGSNIHIHVNGGRVKRVVPAENEKINEIWLSDRDRFSYEGLYSSARILTPRIKQQGEWRETDWETAFDYTHEKLSSVISAYGAGQIGALASPASTLEELFLFQKLLRGIGCANIDHRCRQRDFSDQALAPAYPYLGQSIQEMEQLESVLLIGSNVRKEQPIINHRLRKAANNGGQIMIINPVDYELNYAVRHKRIVAPARIVEELAAIIKILETDTSDQTLRELIDRVEAKECHKDAADSLAKNARTTILLGNIAVAHPDYSNIRGLAVRLAQITKSRLGYLGEASNTSGAWLTGVLPHRLPGAKKSASAGLDAYSMLQEARNAYIIMGLEPEIDCWDGGLAKQAMHLAELVVCLGSYCNDEMENYADVLLPLAPFAETDGSYINNEGAHQIFAAATRPGGEAKPGWKTLIMLAKRFGLPDFEYVSTDEILSEVTAVIGSVKADNTAQWQITAIEPPDGAMQRITDVPMNAIDSITRRAPSLQMTQDTSDGAVHINPAMAATLSILDGQTVRIRQGEATAAMPVIIDERIPDQCALIHAAQPLHACLGPSFGALQIEKA